MLRNSLLPTAFLLAGSVAAAQVPRPTPESGQAADPLQPGKGGVRVVATSADRGSLLISLHAAPPRRGAPVPGAVTLTLDTGHPAARYQLVVGPGLRPLGRPVPTYGVLPRPSGTTTWLMRGLSDELRAPDRSLAASPAIRVETTDSGWVANIRVPPAALPQPGSAHTPWRMTVEACTTPGGCSTDTLELTGLGGRTGAHLALTPHGVGQVRRQLSGIIATTRTQEGGAELTLGPRPDVAVDVVINPDFSSTEPDQERPNLTRFRLYQPERRAWFGPSDQQLRFGLPEEAELFDTRRVGFDSLGREAPVLGAARLRSTAAGLEVDALYALTEENRNQREQQYLVARVARSLGPIRLGLFGVDRAGKGSATDRNRAYGAEGALRLAGWRLAGWAARTESPRFLGGDGAFGVSLARAAGAWRPAVRFTQLGEFFNPDAGFVTRRSVRIYDARLDGAVRLDSRTVPLIEPSFLLRRHDDLDGFNQSSHVELSAGLEFGNSLRWVPRLRIRAEGLARPFALEPTVSLPPGRYRWIETGFDVVSPDHWPIGVTGRVELGGLYDGRQWGGALALSGTPWSHLEVSLLVDHVAATLPLAEVTRTMGGLRAAVSVTPHLSFETLIQYHSTNRLWYGNGRLRWLDAAGTGVSLSYNEAHEADNPWTWVRPQNRGLSLRVSRQVRLFGHPGAAVSR